MWLDIISKIFPYLTVSNLSVRRIQRVDFNMDFNAVFILWKISDSIFHSHLSDIFGSLHIYLIKTKN